MSNISPDSLSQAKALLESCGASHVKIGVTDVDGILRGKYVAGDKFIPALENGLSICDCTLGWDVNDQLYSTPGFTGWHTGYPDAPLRIVPETLRKVPVASGGHEPLVLCEFTAAAEAICPRSLLRSTLEKATAMGLAVTCGIEYEFTLFAETPDSVREKGFCQLNTLTQGNFGYSLLRISGDNHVHRDFLTWCNNLGLPLEALHTENGPGMWEAALSPSDALTAADQAVLFKLFTKLFARQRGLMATFMPKWSLQHQGHGGHAHISLADRETGRPLFFDADAANGMSPTMRHFLAGQQQLLPELLVLAAPNINSYKRLTPGAWAPTSATWGHDNRTAALRVVGQSATSKRIEYRVGGADANPYQVLAGAIASGLYGIERKLTPTDPVAGDACAAELPEHLQLPRSLGKSTERFRHSATVRDLLGTAFVEHFAMSRDWEEAQYQQQISQWELERYFEAI